MDEKAAGFKLGVALATCRPAPVAGESLNRPDESKLSSVRFLLSGFIQSTFTSHTGSLLLSSLKKVTFPSSLVPLVPYIKGKDHHL